MRLPERPASTFFLKFPAISATPRSILAAVLSFSCVFSLTLELPASAGIPAAAKDKKKTDPALKGLPITELNADEAILHALNRLAYGPRPGEIERVRQTGLAKGIEHHLNPNSIDDKANDVPRAIADGSKKPERVVAEVSMAKVTRAIYSERQLQQVMDDFWFNHFNVIAGKGEGRYYLTSYERVVIQPHAFGKFKDLVNLTAKSPAMLFYLDNFLI